jgi:hypothetical protein
MVALMVTDLMGETTAESELDDVQLTDAELSALALAADPDQPLDADAVPLSLYPAESLGMLPLWYMPPAMARGSRGWRTPVVVALVAAFLLIDAFGMCITFGQLVAA